MLDEPRLETLLNAYFDQSLSAEEKAELEQMLLSSARARETFRRHADQHGLLREWALRNQGADLASMAVPQASTRDSRVVPFPKKTIYWLGAGLAACLAVALLAFWRQPSPADESSRARTVARADGEVPWNKVALLAEAVDVEWASDSIRPALGGALPKGWLKIQRGILRLDFYSGVRVVVEGPAEVQLLSPEEARLERGKLTAYVTPPAVGFTVHNREFTVVDRGTEFGMNATGPSSCEVHVFKGEVTLQGGIIKSGEKLLFGGDGVSVRDGKLTSIAPDPNRFVNPELLRTISDQALAANLSEWKARSDAFRSTPGLGVYFDFEDIDFNRQVLRNRSLSLRSGDGVIIGCESVPGRWAQKGALGFARTSDRVRFRMEEGTTPSLTLLAWVRVDGLPLQHNQIFSMAPMQVGEVHWKLNEEGKILVGVRAVNEASWGAWERLESPPVIGEKDFGCWLRLAAVLDGEHGIMKLYLNGREVASGPWKRVVPIKLGVADLGNLAMFSADGQPEPTETQVRNFGGRIDEFAVVTRALSAAEIREFSKWPEMLRAGLDTPAETSKN